jgi:hypothetical protein
LREFVPRVGDERQHLLEEKALLDLGVAMHKIKAKVVIEQLELFLNYEQ